MKEENDRIIYICTCQGKENHNPKSCTSRLVSEFKEASTAEVIELKVVGK